MDNTSENIPQRAQTEPIAGHQGLVASTAAQLNEAKRETIASEIINRLKIVNARLENITGGFTRANGEIQGHVPSACAQEDKKPGAANISHAMGMELDTINNQLDELQHQLDRLNEFV
ncbi:MAG: hypothetical protein KAI73_12510 [Rhodospirillaceae bacterium]|nr:hypothetical protein [Rhodospirillaceae bacterium]